MAATLSGGPTSEPLAGPGAISDALAQIMSRLRLARWVRHASRGALAGTVPALISIVLAHFDLLPDWLPLEATIPMPILFGVLAGTVTTFLRPISQMDAARLAEARLGLKERLSSALEFERSPQSADPEAAVLRRLQLADASVHARSLKAAEAVPVRFPWEAKAFVGALALIAGALIVPRLPVFVPPGVKIERQIVQKTGDKLEQTAKLIQKQADLHNLTGTKRTAAQIQHLGQRMAAGHMDKKQAMVQMSKLTQQMRQELQKTASANSSAGAGGKSMTDAGRQLAQAMAAGQAGSQTGGKQAGAGQKNGAGGAKSGQKASQNAGAGSRTGGSNKFNGFNVPTSGGKSAAGQKNSSSSSQTPTTPEMQKAAQAMQQNDSQALSQQLRQMADKIQSGKMSPSEQQQAAADVQKLSDALKNTPMTETQQHAEAAADALKRGDKQGAASEMRKAAQSAEKEASQQADQQAQSDAAQGVESAESQMAGANSPGDIQDDSGQPGQGQDKGQGKGQGSGQGQGQGDGFGNGQGLASGQGKHGSGKGNGGSGGGGMAGGKAGDSGNGSSPLKHLGKAGNAQNPKGVKLYFGKPENSGPSKTGPTRKVGANPNAVPGQTPSQVPYYDYVAPAAKSAESAMDKEDIPPAYRSDVRRYFNSLNPPAGKR